MTAWKGLMLDIARSFFPLPVLKRLVDVLADLGLNVFHVHLSDDQGWRLEIPGRPELTATSGATAVAGGAAGYLTLADWAELVSYADRRGVTVVPEIDLPGHINAALHACPELNPAGVAPAAYDGNEVGFSRLHLGLPATEPFLRDVLGAVAAVTPGLWLHLGGDECLMLPEAEYVAAMRLAVEIVEACGKRPVAWQEGALAGLGDRLVLQYWRSAPGDDATAPPADAQVAAGRRSRDALLAQAAAGASVIVSPAQYVYFNMRSVPADDAHQDWAGTVDLAKAGAWDPATVLPGLPPAALAGAEACLWTGYIHDEADLDAMLLPRLAVFADVIRGL